jgi:hypothetical protein
MKKLKDIAPRFGIGEWYGYDILKISPKLRKSLAEEALQTKNQAKAIPCPFQPTKPDAVCTKPGGVCSLRQYSSNNLGEAVFIPGQQGQLRTTCPKRLHEGDIISKWAGEVIINDSTPEIISEQGFLESSPTADSDGGDDVGRFDWILFSNKTPLGGAEQWLALEIQSVYFSGNAMKPEFEAILKNESDNLMFPVGRRRPDYRSSATKRLLPQLQTKVIPLRRWGKKIAVAVDRSFFDSLGEIETVDDISNADIAWFIVGFDGESVADRSTLVCDEVKFTTLEKSVEVLTGGRPVSLKKFEERIIMRLRGKS